MALDAAVGSFALNTSLGNQTVSSVGLDPKAIIFFYTSLTAAGTGIDPESGIGVTDGTRDGVVAQATDDGGTGNRQHHVRDDACIVVIDKDANVVAQASIVSLGTDQFTISVDVAPASGIKVQYLALGGSSLTNVFVVHDILASGAGTYSTVEPGFTPDSIFLVGANDVSAFNATAGDFNVSVGTALSTTNRWSNAMRARTAPGGEGSGLTTEQCFIGSDDGAAKATAWDFTSFDANGFSLTEDTADDPMAMVALCLKGASLAAGTTTQPTSTGTVSETGFGFEPSCVVFSGADQAGATTGGSNFAADAEWSFGAGDGTNEAAIYSGQESGNAADMALSEGKAIVSYTPGTPTLDADADLTLDSGGFTLDWTTADATQRVWGYLALGPATAAAAGDPAGRRYYDMLLAGAA